MSIREGSRRFRGEHPGTMQQNPPRKARLRNRDAGQCKASGVDGTNKAMDAVSASAVVDEVETKAENTDLVAQEQIRTDLWAVCQELEGLLQGIKPLPPKLATARWLNGRGISELGIVSKPVTRAIQAKLTPGTLAALGEGASTQAPEARTESADVRALDAMVEAQQSIADAVAVAAASATRIPEILAKVVRLQEESANLQSQAAAARRSSRIEDSEALIMQAFACMRQANILLEQIVQDDEALEFSLEGAVEEAQAALCTHQRAKGTSSPKKFALAGGPAPEDVVDKLLGVASRAMRQGNGKVVKLILRDLDMLTTLEQPVARGNIIGRAVLWLNNLLADSKDLGKVLIQDTTSGTDPESQQLELEAASVISVHTEGAAQDDSASADPEAQEPDNEDIARAHPQARQPEREGVAVHAEPVAQQPRREDAAAHAAPEAQDVVAHAAPEAQQPRREDAAAPADPEAQDAAAHAAPEAQDAAAPADPEDAAAPADPEDAAAPADPEAQ